jgi:DNA replication initiation complex subunit (GINS family)
LYSELYSAWQNEIENADLVPLPSDFYPKVSAYVKRMEEEAKDLERKTLKAGLLEHELKNVRHLIRRVTRIRCRKLKMIIAKNRKIPSGVLTPEEEKMCQGLLNFAQTYHAFAKSLIDGKAQGVEPEPPAPLQRRVVVRFLQPIPAIIGSDMKTYGPFAPEDVGSVPVENARILVKQGFAAIVETS